MFCSLLLITMQCLRRVARTQWDPPFPVEQASNDDETTVKMNVNDNVTSGKRMLSGIATWQMHGNGAT